MRLFAIILFLPIALAAQQSGADPHSPANWERLKPLRQGEPLSISGKDGKIWKGAFQYWTASSLAIQTGTRNTELARGDVKRVERRSQPRRLRNALIGAAIGAAAGVTLYSTLGARLRNEGQSEPIHALMIIGPIGLGTGVGAAFPSYEVIYRAPRR